MWHVWWKGKMHTGFWWGYLKGKRTFGRRKLRWENNIKTAFNKKSMGRGLDLSRLRGVMSGDLNVRICISIELKLTYK